MQYCSRVSDRIKNKHHRPQLSSADDGGSGFTVCSRVRTGDSGHVQIKDKHVDPRGLSVVVSSLVSLKLPKAFLHQSAGCRELWLYYSSGASWDPDTAHVFSDMPPRRSHTKSRNGCGQCKKRRVKVGWDLLFLL